jgi:hypothetical protein
MQTAQKEVGEKPRTAGEKKAVLGCKTCDGRGCVGRCRFVRQAPR